MAKLIQLAKMTGVIQEADHAYSTWSTLWINQSGTDVPFIINTYFMAIYVILHL